MGTNNIISKAQRNFRNELFDSVEAQRNSAIAVRYFRTKSKRNLTSATKISRHNANTAFFAILDRKRANNLLKKAGIYQYYDRNGTKLSSMYSIALLTEKMIENSAQQTLKALVHNETSAIAEVALCLPLVLD